MRRSSKSLRKTTNERQVGTNVCKYQELVILYWSIYLRNLTSLQSEKRAFQNLADRGSASYNIATNMFQKITITPLHTSKQTLGSTCTAISKKNSAW